MVNQASNGVSVLLGLNTGDIDFSLPAQNISFGNTSFPVSIKVLDIIGDGNVDIITGNQNSDNVSIAIGNGNATLQTAQNFLTGDRPESIAIDDFNHPPDGRLDIAVANLNTSTVAILLQDQNGFL